MYGIFYHTYFLGFQFFQHYSKLDLGILVSWAYPHFLEQIGSQKKTFNKQLSINLHLLEWYSLYLSTFLTHCNKSLKWKMKYYVLVKDNVLIKYQFWGSSCSVSIKFLDPCTIYPSFQSWNKNFKTINIYLLNHNTYI